MLMIKTYCYSFQEIIVSPVEMYLMEISFVCYTLLYIFPSFGCLYIYICTHYPNCAILESGATDS